MLQVGAVAPDDSETRAIRGAVGHAGVIAAFGQLPAGAIEHVDLCPIDFIFPAHDLRAGKPRRHLRKELGGWAQFRQQRTAASREFPGVYGSQFAVVHPLPGLAEHEIAHGSRMKHCVERLWPELQQGVAKAGGGAEGNDPGGVAFPAP